MIKQRMQLHCNKLLQRCRVFLYQSADQQISLQDLQQILPPLENHAICKTMSSTIRVLLHICKTLRGTLSLHHGQSLDCSACQNAKQTCSSATEVLLTVIPACFYASRTFHAIVLNTLTETNFPTFPAPVSNISSQHQQSMTTFFFNT